MKKKYQSILLTISIVLTLNGCGAIPSESITPDTIIEKNTSVVLLGIKGGLMIDNLYFSSAKGDRSTKSVFNYYVPIDTYDIVALKVPTPQKSYEFGSFRNGAQGSIFFRSEYNRNKYKPVSSKPLDINKKGIYFYGILDTDLLLIDQEPTKELLEKAKTKYKEQLKDLKPINFKW